MIVVLKPLFEYLTGDVVVCNNIIFNYLALLVIGELAYKFAKRMVGSAYHAGFIDGSNSGSALHWFVRFLFYIAAAYFLRFCIWVYVVIRSIPPWGWFVIGGIIVAIIFIPIVARIFKTRISKSSVSSLKEE